MRTTGPLQRCRISLLSVLALLAAGCLNIGPSTIVQDRFRYNQAIRDSWEEQMLTNMVAIRYGESPVFLNISSVIAQYGLETSANVAAGLNSGFGGSETLEGGGRTVWSERPTITYTPVEGQDFAVNLLTPISPTEIFALIEAGWNAERSLRLLLKSINGVSAYDPTTQQLNPAFFQVLNAFKALQDQEALGIRRETDGDMVRTYLYLREVEANPIIEEALEVIVGVLRLASDGEGVEVVFGPYFKDPHTITVQTMSVMDILNESAAYIVVPDSHVREGRTAPNRLITGDPSITRPLLNVQSAENQPDDALVAVKSRDHWFYIDDKDIDSKKAFSFLMILMQLSAAQQESRGPVVTIGTG
jgi:hypothetical protein